MFRILFGGVRGFFRTSPRRLQSSMRWQQQQLSPSDCNIRSSSSSSIKRPRRESRETFFPAKNPNKWQWRWLRSKPGENRFTLEAAKTCGVCFCWPHGTQGAHLEFSPASISHDDPVFSFALRPFVIISRPELCGCDPLNRNRLTTTRKEAFSPRKIYFTSQHEIDLQVMNAICSSRDHACGTFRWSTTRPFHPP